MKQINEMMGGGGGGGGQGGDWFKEYHPVFTLIFFLNEQKKINK